MLWSGKFPTASPRALSVVGDAGVVCAFVCVCDFPGEIIDVVLSEYSACRIQLCKFPDNLDIF